MAADSKDQADNNAINDTPEHLPGASDNDVIEATVVERSQNEPETTKMAAPSNTSHDTKGNGHKGVWFLGFFNLILILSLAAAAYWYWIQQQNQVTQPNPKMIALENAVRVVNTELAQLSSTLVATETQNIEQQTLLSELTDTSIQHVKNLDDLAQRVNLNELKNEGLAKRIADVSGRRPADWLLAEADYLVKLAGRKVAQCIIKVDFQPDTIKAGF